MKKVLLLVSCVFIALAALFTFSVSFRLSVFSAIAIAIPSSSAAASEASRLTEIPTEKVNKAALAATDHLISDKQQAPSYPIGFDTTLFHITVNFPAPARKLPQKDAGNYLFAADKSVKVAGRRAPVEETYSLLYQQMQTGAKAEDVANQFIDVLRRNPDAKVQELYVATLPSEGSMDQLYRAVEVVEGKRTDYYIFRVIATGDGVLVAVRTIQKSDGHITDLSDPSVWQFVDSVNVRIHQ